jgi:hypothetical protein
MSRLASREYELIRPAVPRVLIDTSVLSEGHFARHETGIEAIPGYRRKLEMRIPGFVRRPVHHNRWRREQELCIPTIARLINEVRIEGLISREIQLEHARALKHEPCIGNVFSCVSLGEARVPVGRNRFFRGRHSGASWQREGLVALCRELLQIEPNEVAQQLTRPGLNSHFDEFERRSLLDLATFHEICRGITETHYPDAYHLWTAERNEMDFYCMIEKRFPNEVDRKQRQRRLRLRCQIVTPDGLLKKLGITELYPIPLREGWFYDRSGIGEELPKDRT